MKLLNKLITLFIFEQDEKLELEEKNRILLSNLLNFTLFIIVFAEGVYSLLNEEILFAGPLLIFSLFYLINYLFIARRPQELHFRTILLIISFLTFSFFIVFGGNTEYGIIWTFIFPLFVIPIFGKSKGIIFTLILLLIIILDFWLLSSFIPYSKQYILQFRIIFIAFYLLSVFFSYTLQFITSEIILNKERLMLDTQNVSRSQEEHINNTIASNQNSTE